MTCIWEYDKRSVNGANFVYYGMFLKGVEGEREKALCAYAKQVVESLEIVHGPSHMEVRTYLHKSLNYFHVITAGNLSYY